MSHMVDGVAPYVVEVTVTVAVSPVAFGFDVPEHEQAALVTAAIDGTPGLEVVTVHDFARAGA